MESPHYPYKPIYTLESLALMLGESVLMICKLAESSQKMYRRVPQVKKDGTERETFDAHEPLKLVQRKIVDRILAKIVFPSYLHGGIRDACSPRSIYSNVKSHAGARSIILQDIKNFFPSITAAKVFSVFIGVFKFGDEVASLLTKLVTRDGVVPQGASTSSYIANLVFWNVEPRMVSWINAQGMSYSRFADDISISSKSLISDAQKTEIVRRVTGMLASKGFFQKRSKMHVLKKGQAITSSKHPEPLIVTGLSIAGTRAGVTKKERKQIRSAVREFELEVDAGREFFELKKMYSKAMGRVGRLLACGQLEGAQLKDRLNAAIKKANKPLLEKYKTNVAQ